MIDQTLSMTFSKTEINMGIVFVLSVCIILIILILIPSHVITNMHQSIERV